MLQDSPSYMLAGFLVSLLNYITQNYASVVFGNNIPCGDDYMFTTTIAQTAWWFFTLSTNLITSSTAAFYVFISELFRVISTDFMDFQWQYQKRAKPG